MKALAILIYISILAYGLMLLDQCPIQKPLESRCRCVDNPTSTQTCNIGYYCYMSVCRYYPCEKNIVLTYSCYCGFDSFCQKGNKMCTEDSRCIDAPVTSGTTNDETKTASPDTSDTSRDQSGKISTEDSIDDAPVTSGTTNDETKTASPDKSDPIPDQLEKMSTFISNNGWILITFVFVPLTGAFVVYFIISGLCLY